MPVRILVLIVGTLVIAAFAQAASNPLLSRLTPGQTSLEPVPANSEPLLVLAASDLQFALPEIVAQYERETGTRVTVSMGSTGNIAAQIQNGAPADLFFAADETFLANLEQRGLLVEGTRQLYAVGRIAVIPYLSSPLQAKSLEDLTRTELRTIAIANPEHAPYGMAAQQALQAAGLWERVQPKLVLGENVSQAFQFVQTGNADAGIVALSVTLGIAGTPYTLVDDSLHAPLRQSVAVIKTTKQEAAARAFLQYVSAPQGRAIMTKYGFVLPGA